jgi:hypothetical protein
MNRPAALLRRAAGPVPAGYWLVLALLYAVTYVFWRYHGKPWSGDALYYTAMAFHYAGHSVDDAIRLTGAYFQDPDIQRLHRGFDSATLAPLIYPRVVYPALSVPFVLLIGGAGMWVVPLLSSLFLVWGLMRLLARLYTPGIATGVTALFMVTVAFKEFGTGLFTESPTMAFVAAILLLLPLGGRRFGRRAAVGCALLLVAIAFCRQSAPVVVSAVCCAWLWTVVRRRTFRGNEWNRPVAVLLPVGLAVTLFLQWWAPYDVLAWYTRVNDEPDTRTALLHMPQIFVHLTLTDSRTYFTTDGVMLVLWCAALLACAVRPLSVHTGLFAGALAPSMLLSVLNSTASSYRYYVPMYPILLLAAAGLLHHLMVRRREPAAGLPAQPAANTSRELAGTVSRAD